MVITYDSKKKSIFSSKGKLNKTHIFWLKLTLLVRSQMEKFGNID